MSHGLLHLQFCSRILTLIPRSLWAQAAAALEPSDQLPFSLNDPTIPTSVDDSSLLRSTCRTHVNRSYGDTKIGRERRSFYETCVRRSSFGWTSSRRWEIPLCSIILYMPHCLGLRYDSCFRFLWAISRLLVRWLRDWKWCRTWSRDVGFGSSCTWLRRLRWTLNSPRRFWSFTSQFWYIWERWESITVKILPVSIKTAKELLWLCLLIHHLHILSVLVLALCIYIHWPPNRALTEKHLHVVWEIHEAHFRESRFCRSLYAIDIFRRYVKPISIRYWS